MHIVKNLLQNLVFSVFFLFSISLYTQSRVQEIDSLKRELSNFSGKEKVMLYEKILKRYSIINLDSGLYYNTKMLDLAREIKHDSLEIYASNLKGDIQHNKALYKESMATYQKALLQNNKFERLRGYSLNGLGNNYSKLENFEKAVSIFIEVLDIFEKTKDTFMIIGTNIHLANDFRKLKDLDNAEMYYERAIKFNNKKNEFLDNFIFNNLSDLYNDMNKPEKSLENSAKALAYFKKMDYKSYQAYPLFNRAVAYEKLNKNTLAEDNFLKAINIHKKFKNEFELANSYNGLAALYLKTNKINKAIDAAKKVVNYSNNVKSIEFQISANKTISKAFEKKNRATEALFYYKIYDSLNNKFYETNKLKFTKNLSEKYQTEKKEKELLQTRTEKAETELQLSKTRTWTFVLLGGLAILVFLGFAIFQRNKRKHQLAIANQKEKNLQAILFAEEKERSGIARELHDGVVQQIGSIILKSRALFTKLKISDNIDSKEVLETLENSNQDIRNISHQMMPRALSELGLISAIDDLLKGSLDYVNINYTFEHFNLKERLSEKIEITLYRITQELVNNIIKHSKATSVSVQLINSDDNILLIIEDDGVGIDDKKTGKGIGFANIKSRLAMINGEAIFDKSPEKGTLVTVKIKK